MYASIYRHALLPLFDRYKGRKTLSYWQRAEESQWWSTAELETLQLLALRELVNHAAASSPYYAEQFSRLNLSAQRLVDLQAFQAWPLLTRETIREQRLRLRSTNVVRRLAKSTGGSSGEPLHFDLDFDSNDRRTAMMYRGYGWAQAQPGSRQLLVWGVPLGNVPQWKRWKMALHRRLEHQRLVNCFDFAPDRLAGHIRALKRYRPDTIVAYTNPVYELARFAEQAGLSVHSPKSIVVGAEKLHDHQRQTLERVFRAPVFETYGSREFMLIGAECDQHTGLHLSMENLLVEIVNDDGSPTPAGEEGQVVITDLYNYAMPFIRYVTGDRAVAGWSKCPCGRGLPLMKKVVGRQLDVLRSPRGKLIPGEFFPHLLKDFPAIRRFQVVQSAVDVLELKVVTDGGLALADRERLLSEVVRCTGDDLQIRLLPVDDIPLTRAGKHRVVVVDPAVLAARKDSTSFSTDPRCERPAEWSVPVAR